MGTFPFPSVLPEPDILFSPLHTTLVFLPQLLLTTLFPCPKSMVCRNCLLFLRSLLHLITAFNHFIYCRDHYIATESFHPHSNFGYLLSLSLHFTSCLGHLRLFLTQHFLFTLTFFVVDRLSCPLYEPIGFCHFGRILVSIGVLRLIIAPAMRATGAHMP